MQQVKLGNSGETISELCLGSMTWGTQTEQPEAHRQIEMALAAGIDIIDTAEMYPVNPVTAENVGKTEAIIGNWLGANPSRRGEVKVATKITGANGGFVRDGAGVTAKTLRQALEGSLKRLQSDYVDIYQLHWPNRGSYHFRQNWSFDPSAQNRAATIDNMREVLEEAAKLVAEGKLRHFALSNESAWGTTSWLNLAEAHGLPRVQSVQNEYSLLCRHYDTDMAEMAVNEEVTLLAYSPLATGLLTGKYQNGATPEGSRILVYPDLGGRRSPRAFEAVGRYLEIAERHGLDPVHMALAFLQSRPFAVSSIFGARTCEQLEHILKAADLRLSKEVLDEIKSAHQAVPLPY